MAEARTEAAKTLRRAAKAAQSGDVKKAQALTSIAEEFRILADVEKRPIGFRKHDAD